MTGTKTFQLMVTDKQLAVIINGLKALPPETFKVVDPEWPGAFDPDLEFLVGALETTLNDPEHSPEMLYGICL